ncbi:MAG: glycosyl hydrolase [Rhodothermaceae bacterium]|nr:glycosyl hydrolase [Rhodothermaceae bacterium]MXW33191.1 glycosyl hydrolase [Rhodothermaceae bacterium]MYC03536.1 glycosyl hydrolase [Rhodothermaceae bacterium]MYE61846.1 glycosyl hydrolase [Rhodothermaceae bacterium]MYI17785.1 glycosyl hydrolase [Rhodothermaceae bacterium]
MLRNQILQSALGLITLLLIPFWSIPGSAQPYDSTYYSALEFRSVGPYRGGRSAAVSGVPGQPMKAYFGATGGGVWESTTGGASWENISDGYFGGSIGAVAVSTWDPNVIYVGGGEKTVRGNVSHGCGVYKSLDAGRTWEHKGLSDSHRIPRIRIHPRDPDHVYAAVMGHLSGPNEERGIYRSLDGGDSWEKILFINDEVGFVDLAMDPSNPRILYASAWRVIRTPYSLESGGEGSGIWKSTDGGDSWKEITGKDNGLPLGTLGISGIAISPVNPDRIWVIIEAAQGGVFRSDDGGETWRKINEDRNLRQRAWYYTRIYADTGSEDIVYVVNVQFWRSKDGGRTYSSIQTPHGDHHDLWINPDDPNHLIVADDGGAQVSFDAGANWSTYYNQPTAQFYRVTTDSHFPYRILGAQQDNSTVRILHTSNGRNEREWEPTAGGESGWLAPKPDQPQIVYGGSYGGYLTRVDHDSGERRAVNVHPDNPMGHGAEGMKYRFQWNFPIVFSMHDHNVLYAAGNHLFRTTNEGQSWEMMSPDLTRADSTKLGPSGGPITKDNTGVEYYATIFAMAESPHDAQVIWVGSDDGLVHITRDGGDTWTDITPEVMPEWMQINELVAHPMKEGAAYLAGTRYKLDDFSPYIYRTTNYGADWELIVDGIDSQHFTRSVQPDHVHPGLLWAGTESGLYISFDDGQNWNSFQQNLPIVPITDLDWKENDLIVATQGRSFWIMEDVTPLHQLPNIPASSSMWLYDSDLTWRTGASVNLRYWFREAPDSSTTKLEILESDGTLIKSFSAGGDDLQIEAGMNVFSWNTRYEDAESFDGLIMWAGNVRGPRAAPGTYRARLVTGEDSLETTFELRKDPRSGSSVEDLQMQFEFLIGIRDKLSEMHRAIKDIRAVRSQIRRVISNLDEEHADIKDAAEALIKKITAIEEMLYQTKNQSRQDPLNFPIRLNNKLAAVASNAAIGDFRPTDQAVEVRDELVRQTDIELEALQVIFETDLPDLNEMIWQENIPAINLNSNEFQ